MSKTSFKVLLNRSSTTVVEAGAKKESVIEFIWEMISCWLLALGTSLFRILLGIVLALAAGVLLSLLTTRFRFFYHLFSPLWRFARQRPWHRSYFCFFCGWEDHACRF